MSLLRLAPADVDIWTARPPDLGDALPAYDALLLDIERRRQQAYMFERNRLEYLVTRAVVRTTLSRYRPTLAAEWRFRANEYGRPEIDPPCGLHFNLSNHPTMVVCAVTESAEVGVDVEPVERGASIVAIAGSVFAPRELAELRALEGVAQTDRAVTLWTLKEAYIKARGMGLSLPLDKFAFHFAEGSPPTITFAPPIDDDPRRWTFSTRDVAGHRIALAVESWSRPTTVTLHAFG